MKKLRKPPSLRKALTRQLIWMQTLVLTVFTLLAGVAILNVVSREQGLDAAVIEEIGRSVVINATGTLDLVPNKRLSRIVSEYPNFWVYAVDAAGDVARLGNVPAEFERNALNLTRISSANISDIGSPDTTMAIIRQYDSDAGSLWIATAGGPLVGWKMISNAFANPIFLGLLFLLTVVSIVVVPLIVRRELRGVDAIAAQADTIDVNQPGIRLSSERVPSELHSLVRAINSALQRLDDGIEQRQRFLADAAHELRTPIAILHTRIELLPEGAERSRLMLDVARLANLANQLLDLQRLDTSRTAFQAVNLVDLAAQVASDMAPLVIAAGDEISFDSETETIMVDADAAAISRAVVNLIQNAIAHGGKATQITVAVLQDGTLRVTDTGPGVAEQYREAIFEPFHRITPLDHGAGLGLNLVKDIVARHQGRVVVSDAVGGGAQFEIVLPLAAAALSSRINPTANVR